MAAFGQNVLASRIERFNRVPTSRFGRGLLDKRKKRAKIALIGEQCQRLQSGFARRLGAFLSQLEEFWHGSGIAAFAQRAGDLSLDRGFGLAQFVE
jgi:hypothetical protein